MTRLANLEKIGYYPTPPTVTEQIATHISAPQGGRILDPCAGEGTALVTLARTLNALPYGVELHDERAESAKAAIADCLTDVAPESTEDTHLIHDSYTHLVTFHNGFNLLYLNPPYDYDAADGRLEYQWLWRMRPYLQPGGLLVYVVPQHILKMRKAANYLAAHFEQLRVYRFPDGEYERFRQVVVFGVRRTQGVTPDTDLVQQLRVWGEAAAGGLLTDTPLPVLSMAAQPLYSLPQLAVKPAQLVFRSQFVDPATALAEAQRVGAAATAGWRQHLDPAAVTLPLRPLTPLKIGHMHSIIAAGHLNNQLLTADTAEDAGDVERLLIKGRSYKTTRHESYSEPLEDGGSRLTETDTEVVVTDITTLDANGAIRSYQGADLEQFLTRWIEPLTQIVARTYTPVYRFDLNGYGRLLNGLSKQRQIPGLGGQTGLLPAQKHAAAAVLTRLERHPDAIVVGEMGAGKTTIGAAIAAGRHAQRTVILCPPHLVDKWQRECRAVWPGVVTMHLQTISDVDAFFTDRRDGRPVIGVLKQTSARSASGWEHAYLYGGAAAHDYGSKGFNDIRCWWSEQITAVKAAKKGETTLTPRQLQAIHERGVACPICGTQQESNGRPLSPSELKSARRRCSNTGCNEPLYQFKRRRSGGQVAGSFGRYAERERAIRSGTILPDLPLPRDLHGYAKTPLAGYIKRVARDRLDLAAIDESHQYKSSDSDQGYAMHHLGQAASKIVMLTGTIYGGKASSLFHLLYRTAPALVQAYTDPAATGTRRIRSQDWVASYGILQRIETTKLDEHGRQTANSRSSVRYKELPGGSPAMLPWLLNRSVFLALGDMGFPLPDYTEIPVEVPMAAEQALLYESLKAQLLSVLKERLVRGDKSLLAGYLYALLFWPDAPRRAKVVRDPRTEEVVASIPGLDDSFTGPKETAIIELCQQEKAAGRKVLLLCLQTDTLDIQPEWQQMLGNAGLQTAVLRAAPNQREGWVERQVAAGVDVVISHPKKVETGLDLLDFPTIVWMAPHYSVYTVLQASRRSWRIGQTQPVKVYYFAYAETIQADALYLVAAKVAAALRVNGDTVADDSLADLDDLAGGDIVATLAKIVTGDSELTTHSLQQAFAEANAALRQTNTIIGEYTLIDEADDEPVADGDALSDHQADNATPAMPSVAEQATQPSLLTRSVDNPPAPASSTSIAEQSAPVAEEQPVPPKPPVPRPRLLIQLN